MIGFYEDDLRFLIALCREHCAVLRIEFREAHGDPAMQQILAQEMQQARRCARKLKRVIGEVGPTPHADALLKTLPKEWGIKG